MPELLNLAQEVRSTNEPYILQQRTTSMGTRSIRKVRSTNEPYILQQEGEDLAMLTPIKPVVKRSIRGKPVTADDSLWKLVGIGHSGKGDISEKKHKYLAEAYLPHNQA
jgi:hypothetical protein